MRLAAYAGVAVGYLYSVIFTSHLTLIGFLTFTAINLAWVATFQHLAGDHACSDQEMRSLIAILLFLACLAQLDAHVGVACDWILACVALGVVASIYPIRTTVVIGVGLWIASVAIMATLDGGFLFDARSYAFTILPAFIFVACFATVTRLHQEAREQSQQLVEDLEAAHRQLQAYANQVEELAITQERNRMAREIHDTLGHYLTILAVKLETATKLEERHDARLHEELVESRRVAAECLAEVRHSIAALRPSQATTGTFAGALQQLAKEFEAINPDVALTLDREDVDEELAPEIRMALYRCAQEALTNIHKHAGATKVLLRLRAKADQAELTVLDNGIGAQSGADGHAAGFGLLGVRERVALLGGAASSGPEPEQGWRVSVIIPLGHSHIAAPDPAQVEVGT
ncbi:MAG TPA: sensor histidine kinase [Ktedonobacterales bacterium]|nr:sensor histidine kinase [Ktedonobacterales bacterium]